MVILSRGLSFGTTESGIQSGGEDVREAEEGEEVVALAEVAGGQDGEDGDKGEGERPEFCGGQVGFEAAEEVQGEQGAHYFGQKDSKLKEEGDREVEEIAEGGGNEQHAHDERRIGFKEFGAVEFCAVQEALGDVEAPELVVTDGGKERDEDGHAGGSEGKDGKAADGAGIFGG